MDLTGRKPKRSVTSSLKSLTASIHWPEQSLDLTSLKRSRSCNLHVPSSRGEPLGSLVIFDTYPQLPAQIKFLNECRLVGAFCFYTLPSSYSCGVRASLIRKADAGHRHIYWQLISLPWAEPPWLTGFTHTLEIGKSLNTIIEGMDY